MRSAVSVAILVCTSFLLAGCGDKGKEDFDYVCPDGVQFHSDDYPQANTTADLAKLCAKGGGSKTNTTSQAPNKLPVLVLNVTDDGGNATSVTMLDGNLTFSAAGSTDPDGTIAGIAVTVTDSNTTRTATLYDAGKKQFKTATFKFDRAGVVNVTVAMVDDRAGFTVNQTHVYVNEEFVSTPQNVAANRPIANFNDCGGASDLPGADNSGDLMEAQFYKEFSFPVAPGATKIEASDAGGVVLTICTPENVSVSGGPANPTMTTPDANLTAPVGTDSYYVSAYKPTTSAPGGVDAAPVIIIHYEPQTDAAPAE